MVDLNEPLELKITLERGTWLWLLDIASKDKISAETFRKPHLKAHRAQAEERYLLTKKRYKEFVSEVERVLDAQSDTKSTEA